MSPKQVWITRDGEQFDNLDEAQEHEDRHYIIQGVAATICGGGLRDKLTSKQRKFIRNVVAPEIYEHKTTIRMHLFPGERDRCMVVCFQCRSIHEHEEEHDGLCPNCPNSHVTVVPGQ